MKSAKNGSRNNRVSSLPLYSPLSTPLPQHDNFISISWPLFKRQKPQVRQGTLFTYLHCALHDADESEWSFDWSYCDESLLFLKSALENKTLCTMEEEAPGNDTDFIAF